MIVHDPLRHFVGTGADSVLTAHAEISDALYGLLIHNGHGRGGELRKEAGVRGVERYGEVRVVYHGKALKRVGLAVLQCLRTGDLKGNIVVHAAGSQKTLERVLHIGSGKRAAVGEDNAVSQRERVGQTVVRDGVAFAEAGDNGGAAVRLDLRLKKTVKYVHGNHVIVRGLRNVHRADVVQRGDAQSAVLHSGGGDDRLAALRGGQSCRGRAARCRREHYCACKQNGNEFFHN